MYKNVAFSREEMFEKVWSTPLLQLADERDKRETWLQWANEQASLLDPLANPPSDLFALQAHVEEWFSGQGSHGWWTAIEKWRAEQARRKADDVWL